MLVYIWLSNPFPCPSLSWFLSKHPIEAPAVKVPLKSAADIEDEDELLGGGGGGGEHRSRSSSVLPYLCQLQRLNRAKARAASNGNRTPEEEGFDYYDDVEAEDEEEFVPYGSSNGSIARINELTIQSCKSNASRASKTSQKCLSILPLV